jgi:hypothetical protein
MVALAPNGLVIWVHTLPRFHGPTRPSETEAVSSGKVATNRMQKHSVAISAALGSFADLGPSELGEKPL